MRTLPHLAVIACLASASAFAGAAAQTAGSELDLEAIRARAASQSAEADALAASARARAEELTDEAKASAASAEAHGKRFVVEAAKPKRPPGPEGTFDFDKMLVDAGTMANESMGKAPRFIAFASTSMPPAALRTMIDDMARAGGVVVFRGLPQNSARALSAALAKVAKPGEQLDGVGIDPRLFRAFGIEAVPAYVVTSSDFDLCDGFDCAGPLPPHDRMIGNVTAGHALETFARGGGPGALLAAQHLARLEMAPQ